jgi:hypothetical protein
VLVAVLVAPLDVLAGPLVPEVAVDGAEDGVLITGAFPYEVVG